MQVEYLSAFSAGTSFEADLIIIGGGPAGLTIAREFLGSRTSVLIVESGQLQEEKLFGDLNTVESIGEPRSIAQQRKRAEFHGQICPTWSHSTQPFGVRCRVLGGSSQAWAGKSAPFSEIDFVERGWVKNSGWPFRIEELNSYLTRAGEVLNLGPNCHDESLWSLIGVQPPKPNFDSKLLRSFFWQFARSRIDKMDIMRFGAEFLTLDAPNIRVLLNATVTQINTNAEGNLFRNVGLATIDGAHFEARAQAAVLAASGIENPRLLLVSNQVRSNGLGNENDLVGRFLMDHPSARLGHFAAQDCPAVMKRFGFFGLKHGGRTHMYMHGLAIGPELQQEEHLLNAAVYLLEQRSPDDPWDALKRLLRSQSKRPLADLATVLASPGLLAKGLAMRLFESGAFPERIRGNIVDVLMRVNPNLVVREFQSRGVPHKLDGLVMDGICEQPPDPDSRITLADQRDRLGVPLARVDWRIAPESRRTLSRMGQIVTAEFKRVGLPAPSLDQWIAKGRPEDCAIIDMGHTLGTTRMAKDPRLGVVDANCRIHGVQGLYVAGGSVFPTSGHANPTLMILALALRLADHIKKELAS